MRSEAIRCEMIRIGVMQSGNGIRSNPIRSDAIRSDAIRSDAIQNLRSMIHDEVIQNAIWSNAMRFEVPNIFIKIWIIFYSVFPKQVL